MSETATELLIDAEVRLIGCVAIDCSVWKDVEKLPPDRFRIDQCRQYWEACQELSEEGESVDLPFVLDRMRKNGHNPNRRFIMDAMAITPSVHLAGEYAAQVEKHYRANRLGLLGEQLSNMTLLGDPDSMQELIRSETELLQGSCNHSVVSTPDAVDMLLEDIAHRETGVPADCTATGFPALDRLLGGGMINAGLYLLAARPGMGKTALALNIAEHVGVGHGVLYVSLEMSISQITVRRLSAVTRIPVRDLMTGSCFTPAQQEQLRSGSEKLRRSRLVLNRRPSATVAEIRSMAREIPDLRLIVVDYLGLVTPSAGNGSRYEKVSEVSSALKKLAISLNIPILALCQLSRECERRDSRRPELSDLRDSGTLEQDADGVIMLYRGDYYERSASRPARPEQPSFLECILRKNRHAGCGSIRLSARLNCNLITQAE